jgi:hypothetical protein
MHSKPIRISYNVGNKHITVWSDLEADVKNRITDNRNSGQSDKYVALIDTLMSTGLLQLPALCGGTLLLAAYSGIPYSCCRYLPARGLCEIWSLCDIFISFYFHLFRSHE